MQACQGVIYVCTDPQAILCQAPRLAVLVRMHISTDSCWHHATNITCLTFRETPLQAFQTELIISISFFPPSSAVTATTGISSHCQSIELQYLPPPPLNVFPQYLHFSQLYDTHLMQAQVQCHRAELFFCSQQTELLKVFSSPPVCGEWISSHDRWCLRQCRGKLLYFFICP